VLKQVKIQHFRGVDNLEINNLQKINLIYGKSTCIKTSILEAIYLLCNYMYPHSILDIARVRGFLEINGDVFDSMFYNLDTEKCIEIVGYLENGERRKLCIKKEPKLIGSYCYILEYIISKNCNRKNMKVCWEIEVEQPNIVNVSLRETSDFKKLENREYRNSIFISPRVNMPEIIKRLKEIQKHKQTKKIVQALKKLENRIEDLYVIDNIIYCNIKGIKRLIPVNILGSETLNALSIFVALHSIQNGYAFIDELENLVQPSTFKTLWEEILRVSNTNNIQIFVTGSF